MNYSIKSLAVYAFALQLKQTASQRFIANFVIEPRVDCPDLMRVQSADIVDADVSLELFSCLSSFFEEV
jgi:hypothetical protein